MRPGAKAQRKAGSGRVLRPCYAGGGRSRAEWRVGLFESSLWLVAAEKRRSQLPFHCRADGDHQGIGFALEVRLLRGTFFLTLNRNLAAYLVL